MKYVNRFILGFIIIVGLLSQVEEPEQEPVDYDSYTLTPAVDTTRKAIGYDWDKGSYIYEDERDTAK